MGHTAWLHAAFFAAWLFTCTNALVPATLRSSMASASALRRTSTINRNVVMMSERAPQSKSKLKTIVKDKVDEASKTKPKDKLDTEGYWRLLLHNDDVHTFEYVTYMIMKIVPNVSHSKAFHLTMTTHTEGVSTVTQTAKPMAEKYCIQLQKGGLTASISPDAGFKDNRSGGDDDGGTE